MLMLMLEEAWGELAHLCSTPSYTRNSPPGYPQICTALAIFSFFFIECFYIETAMDFDCNELPSPHALHALCIIP